MEVPIEICCLVQNIRTELHLFLPVLFAITPMKAGGTAMAMQPKNETTDKTWAPFVVFIENIL
jgi:hypothetical protein